MRNLVLFSLPLLFLLGCERDTQRPAGARTEAQQGAARDACLAEALVVHAEESHAALQEWGFDDALGAGIATAAGEFSRAYLQHAQLRYGSLAHVDSAMNHARAPADSTRHVQTAQGFLPRGFEEGTLEFNVAAAWLRDYATLLADEDHRCHWDI
jgi:hypothetical protein